MDEARLIDLSKLLSLILRHQPQRFGLMLDTEGYAALPDVFAAVRTRMAGATEADLRAVVETIETDKRRFAISDDEIRANYGHSLSTRIAYEIAIPPPYCCTALRRPPS